MRKRVVIGGGVVVLLVALVLGLRLTHLLVGQAPSITYLTATAAVTDVVDTVSVTGSVQPVETYAFAFGQAPVRNPRVSATASSAGSGGSGSGSSGASSGSSGGASGLSASAGGSSGLAGQWTVQIVNVKAGDMVVAGQILAAADTSDAQATLDTARLNLAAAQAKLNADSSPVSATSKAKAKFAITQANRQLSQAKTAQSQTASTGRLAVSQAQAVLSDAQAKLAADQAAGLPSTVISADQAAVSQAQRALATAKQQASTANTQASAAVDSAKLNVQSAQLAYDQATTVDTSALVAADKATVSQAQTAVDNAQTTLSRLTLTAPIAGTVSSVTIQPGDVVSGTVITMRSTDVEVDASVTESDLPAVKVGQPAAVTIGALNASVKGTVSEVDLANATKSASGVVSYAITISLPAAPAGVAPSMTANVDVTTATAASVVAVPTSAVTGSPGSYSVQVVDAPGQAHAVPVQVGLMTSTQAEIRSGLAAGTQVVTGVATAKDLVTTFPTGPGGGTRTPAPSGS